MPTGTRADPIFVSGNPTGGPPTYVATDAASVSISAANLPAGVTDVQSAVVRIMASLRFARLRVCSMGDSICAANNPNQNLQFITVPQLYTNKARMFSFASWLNLGAMRSDFWFLGQYNYGYGGATTATILASCLPALLNNTQAASKPGVVFEMGGTNDIDLAQSLSTIVAGVVANRTAIWLGLLAVGILPVVCTIPPRDTAPASSKAINDAVVAAARTYGLPVADFYTALVDPTNGHYLSGYTTDGVHPTLKGANVMGYISNQVLNSIFPSGRFRKVLGIYDQADATLSRNPNFTNTLAAGTINTASSLPGSWGALGTAAMGTVYNSAGTEPGTGKTMYSAAPTIQGVTPNYQGNTFVMAGDGSHTASSTTYTTPTIAPGDVLGLTFRFAWVPSGSSPAQVGEPTVCLIDQNDGTKLAGISGLLAFSGANETIGIGSETGYEAGEFYTEWTVPAGYANLLTPYISLGDHAGTSSNSGDYLKVANFYVRNLTAAGIAPA